MSDKQDIQNIIIQAKKDGPLLVKGLNRLLNSRGEKIPLAKEVFALCRCGGSANKPFCDGTHSRIGFSGERIINKPLDKERQYPGKEITIHDNRVICAHAAECVEHLSPVFKRGASPWINPDASAVEEIINVIKQCPSGALSYTLDGVHHTGKDLEPGITVSKDGPYNVTGKIELQDENQLKPPNPELFSLCRCGASKNKPFCDGTHHDVGFKGE